MIHNIIHPIYFKHTMILVLKAESYFWGEMDAKVLHGLGEIIRTGSVPPF